MDRESARPMVVAALFGLVVVFAQGPDQLGREAHASGGPAKGKGASRPVPTNLRMVTSKCALDAYAKLEVEKAALKSKYADAPDEFARAYAKRKREIVGREALEAAGCANPTLEPR